MVLAATALAACNIGESATPGLDGSPDLPDFEEHALDTGTTTTADVQPADTDAGGESPATSAVTTTTTTVPAEDDPAPTSTETPADTEAPPVTLDTEATVDSVCASLASDGYETRKSTLEAAGSLLTAMETQCPDELAALTGAIEIENRVLALDTGDAPLTATDLRCRGNNFSLRVTNQTAAPIGLHANLLLNAEGVDEPLGSTLEPLVVWSLGPGASADLTGQFQANRPTDAALECVVEVRPFDAPTSTADASIGGPVVPELAVDDINSWLPFLDAQTASIIGSGDADLAAVVQDIRSSDYTAVLAEVNSTGVQPPETGTISVCTDSIERLDDRHVSVVYFEEFADSSRLQHGLFRRGNDGQWRWLSSPRYFDSQNYWDCGTPSVNS